MCNEMRLLLNLCQGAKAGCPITDTLGIDTMGEAAAPKKHTPTRG